MPKRAFNNDQESKRTGAWIPARSNGSSAVQILVAMYLHDTHRVPPAAKHLPSLANPAYSPLGKHNIGQANLKIAWRTQSHALLVYNIINCFFWANSLGPTHQISLWTFSFLFAQNL